MMNSKEQNINLQEERSNGLGLGLADTSSAEFIFLQEKIKEAAQLQSPKVILGNRLLSIRFKVEHYLNSTKTDKHLGHFIRECVEALQIEEAVFANYVEYAPDFLNRLIIGEELINTDFAIKLEEIFHIKASLWLQIQNKNELATLRRENEQKYRQYSINDLLRKAS